MSSFIAQLVLSIICYEIRITNESSDTALYPLSAVAILISIDNIYNENQGIAGAKFTIEF